MTRLNLFPELTTDPAGAVVETALVNTFPEQVGDITKAVKRPGLTAAAATDVSAGNGVVCFDGTLVSIWDAALGVSLIPASGEGFKGLVVCEMSEAAQTIFRVEYFNGLYLAIGWYFGNAASYLYTSSDGGTWTVNSTLPVIAGLRYITYFNGLYYVFASVAGNTDVYATSPDLLTWTLRTWPTPNYIYDVVLFQGRLVVLAKPAGTSLTVYSTVDGVTWASSNSLLGTTQQGYFAVGPDKLVYVTGDAAGYSTDGVSWTHATIPGSAELAVYGAVWHIDSFFAVGEDATELGAYLHSTDGITWVLEPTGLYFADGLRSLVSVNGVLYTAFFNTNQIYFSTDATDWKLSSISDDPDLLAGIQYLSIANGNLFIGTNGANEFYKVNGVLTLPSPEILVLPEPLQNSLYDFCQSVA